MMRDDISLTGVPAVDETLRAVQDLERRVLIIETRELGTERIIKGVFRQMDRLEQRMNQAFWLTLATLASVAGGFAILFFGKL